MGVLITIPIGKGKMLRIVEDNDAGRHISLINCLREDCGCYIECFVCLSVNCWKTLVTYANFINDELNKHGDCNKYLGTYINLIADRELVCIRDCAKERTVKFTYDEWRLLYSLNDIVEEYIPDLKSWVMCELTHDNVDSAMLCSNCGVHFDIM